ncbi:MAG: YidH family protein [Candidatus Dormibacteraceae bacterium]
MAHQEADAADVGSSRNDAARDHMANTRTFLAWLRTSIALIGLGFVVARFGLFLRELGAGAGNPVNPSSSGLSAVVGVSVVLIGVVLIALSTYRFLRAKMQIDRGRFVVSVVLEVAAGVATLVAGVALAGYLVVNR